MNMIEKVAEELFKTNNVIVANNALAYHLVKDRYIKLARAAIKAMREPTKEMKSTHSQMATFNENYQAMIDKALE